MSNSKNLEKDWSERGKQEYEEFISLINQYVDLEQWGFIQTHSHLLGSSSPVIIYDSQSCRVRFQYQVADYGNPAEREAKVWYGRLHATNGGRYIIGSNGKEASCWHGLWYYVMDFLEGLSSQEVVDHRGKSQQMVHELYQSLPRLDWEPSYDSRKALAIKELRLHNKIWEHYRQKLFDVFDLRNPELWEKYVQFHNEVKRLKYETWKAKEKIGKPFKQFEDFAPDELW